MDEPLGTERRNQTSGIHTSYSIGPAGQRVKIILVDVRSNKEGSYGSGDLLGEAQWEWLERELTNSDAQIHIIGSGIQVLPAAKPVQEKWGAFPQSRERLMALLAKTRPNGLILISGDVHYAELMRFPGACSPTGADIWEATSSGLTHTCDDGNTGICKLALNTLLKTAYHEHQFITVKNWGSIDIDWDSQLVKMSIHDLEGVELMSQAVTFSGRSLAIPDATDCSKYDQPATWIHLIPFEHLKWAVWGIAISLGGSLVLLAYFCLTRSPNSRKQLHSKRKRE